MKCFDPVNLPIMYSNVIKILSHRLPSTDELKDRLKQTLPWWQFLIFWNYSLSKLACASKKCFLTKVYSITMLPLRALEQLPYLGTKHLKWSGFMPHEIDIMTLLSITIRKSRSRYGLISPMLPFLSAGGEQLWFYLALSICFNLQSFVYGIVAPPFFSIGSWFHSFLYISSLAKKNRSSVLLQKYFCS